MTKNDDKRIPALRFKGFNDDWAQQELKDLVSFYSGLTYHPEDIKSTGVFVIRSSNIKHGQLVNADNVYVDPKSVNSTYVRKKDIIVVVRNGSRNLIGKHAQVHNDISKSVIGAFMTGIRSNNNDFISALFDSDKFRKEIHKNLGATINQITTGEFKKMIFPTPQTLNEKEKIGNLISQINSLVSLQQRKLKQVELLKKYLLQNLFPTKNEKNAKLLFKGHKEIWREQKANDIFTEVDTRKVPDNTILSTTQNGKVVPRNSLGRNLVFSTSKLKNYKLVRSGQFIIHLRSFKGGFATSSLTGIVSPTYTIFDFKNRTKHDTKFWSILFTNYNFIQSLKSVTEGIRYNGIAIKFSQFSDLKISFPQLSTQMDISKIINCLNLSLEKQKLKIQKLQKTKQFLLQNMFI